MHFCKVCNKGFSCGGALGGHMRAHGIEEINARAHEEENKRTYFLRTTTNRFVSYRAREEEDLANCLVMLSNGKADHKMLASINRNSLDFTLDENEKSKEQDRSLFQCKACKKVFKSHQALGGHRASHKKVKGCFAAKYENMMSGDYDDNAVEENNEGEIQKMPLVVDLNHSLEQEVSPRIDSIKRKSKMHECSICKRAFSSGQALGGHKRCHWHGSFVPENYPLAKYYGFEYYHGEPLYKKFMLKQSEPLDLNLPTLVDHESYSSKFQGQMRIYLPPRTNGEMGEKHRTVCADLVSGDKSEDQCKVKLARLGDMRSDGECSTWLQVGIGSNVEEEKRLHDFF